MQPRTIIDRLLRRATAALVAGLIVVLAASDPGSNWVKPLLQWMRSSSRPVISHQTANQLPIGTPVTVTPARPLGNDSSVSPVPRPLILVRTQLGRNSREGFAQIGVNAQSPQTYSAGALLVNGARLTEIYAHYVVLERDGHSVRLYLQSEPQPDAARNAGIVSVGGAAPPAPTLVKSGAGLTAYLRPSPVFVENQLHGYALYPAHDPSFFSRLGLEPGDVLTEINGAPIASSTDSLTALGALTEGNSLTVVVERQGTSQTLSLDGSLLARTTAEEPMSSTNYKTSYQSDFKTALRHMTGSRDP